MRSNIALMADFKPHIAIQTDGKAHVIPRAFFENVIKGTISFSQLEDENCILRAILQDWLNNLDT